MEVFNDYAYYYNLFYQDKDYRAEAGQIKELLIRYGQGYDQATPNKSILTLGCGTGKHDFALAEQGYVMTGIDISPAMIEVARQTVIEPPQSDIMPSYFTLPVFEVADIRTYQPPQIYDAAISLFHVISYQNQNEDVLQAFETANKALANGGLFIFDVWYGPGVLTDKPSVRVKKVCDGNNLLIRYAHPLMSAEDNLVDVGYEVLVIDQTSGHTSAIEEHHRMRYFFKPELEFMLAQKGFSLLACVDCATLRPTNYDSWTAYFIARKNG